MKEPKFRFVPKLVIEELVSKYNFEYSDWMQDWPYEIANSKEINHYFKYYEDEINEDKKFGLMQMLIQALNDIEDDNDFNRKWILLNEKIIKDFKIHEYTIYYWSCFGLNLIDCWKITPNMRELWDQVKNQNIKQINNNTTIK